MKEKPQEKRKLSERLQKIESLMQELIKVANGNEGEEKIDVILFGSDKESAIVRRNSDNIDKVGELVIPLILNYSSGYIFESLLKNSLYRSSAFTRGMKDATFRANWERIEREDIKKAQKEKEKQQKEEGESR